MQAPRYLVIGLDSADSGLTDELCQSGDLPVLQSLRDEGAYGTVVSPAGLGDDAVWPMFYTGVSPAHTGRYHFRQLVPGTYDYKWSRDFGSQKEAFWGQLSRQGYRIGILDVPKCELSTEINGFHVVDWRVHGPDQTARSQPPSLAEDLVTRYGEDVTERRPDWLCHVSDMSPNEEERFERLLLDSVRAKVDVAGELIRSEPWDLFLVVFKEIHCAGHQFWRHVMEGSESGTGRARSADRLTSVYRALDQAIGSLCELAGPTSGVLVFSDLSMGPNYTGEHLLDDILLRLDPRWATSLFQRAAELADLSKSPAVHRVRRGLKRRMYSRRSFFQVDHNEVSGAVRINLKGREPSGTVEPGLEYDETLSFLEDGLKQLVDPGTGRNVVSDVLRTHEAFQGPQQEHLPDLFVIWERSGPIERVYSKRTGTVSKATPDWRSGNHVSGGWYILNAPLVPQGPSAPASILDLAPTIAAALGASLEGVEGRPLVFGA